MTFKTCLALLALSLAFSARSQTFLPDKYAQVIEDGSATDIQLLAHLPADSQSVWHVDRLALVSGGTASVDADRRRLTFRPQLGFRGTAFIYYTLRDTGWRRQEGVVRLDVVPSQPSFEPYRRYFTQKGTPLMLVLPHAARLVSASSGQCTAVDTHNRVYRYQPLDAFEGVAELYFEADAGADRPQTLVAEVVVLAASTQSFSAPAQTFQTDLQQRGDTIAFEIPMLAVARARPTQIEIWSADTVSHQKWQVWPIDTLNRLFFVAKTNITEGVSVFSMRLQWGADSSHSFPVFLAAGAHLPADSQYVFSAIKGRTHTWDYPIGAILGGHWTALQAPLHGQWRLEPQGVTYMPAAHTSANQDVAVLRYCAASGACQTVRCQIQLLDSLQVPLGVAPDGQGVWPGDTDADGQVGAADVVAVATHLAAEQPRREGVPAAFLPFRGTWPVDANGDGFVSDTDLREIERFWGEKRTFIPQKPQAIGTWPLTVSSDMAALRVGDEIHLDIALGSAEQPVLDMSHLRFSIQMDNRQLNINTLTAECGDLSWLTQNQPHLTHLQYGNGQHTVVVSNLHRRKSSGYGRVARVKGIVIDDINGFSSAARRSVTWRLSNIQIGNADGQVWRLPDQIYEWHWETASEKAPFTAADVQVYPNPSRDYIDLYVIGDNQLHDIDVLDMMGRDMGRAQPTQAKSVQINTSDWPSGLYFLRINTDKGSIIKKIQVIH